MSSFIKRIERLSSLIRIDDLMIVFMDENGQESTLPFPEWKARGYSFDSFVKVASGGNLNQVDEILGMIDSVIG